MAAFVSEVADSIPISPEINILTFGTGVWCCCLGEEGGARMKDKLCAVDYIENKCILTKKAEVSAFN